MGKNTKLKEKQKWFEEELHFEDARKLRGILRNFTGHSRSHRCFQLLTRVLDGFLEFRILGVDEINCGSEGSNKNKTKFACTIPPETISNDFGGFWN